MTSFDDRLAALLETIKIGGNEKVKLQIRSTIKESYSPDSLATFLILRFLSLKLYKPACIVAKVALMCNRLFQPFTPAVLRKTLSGDNLSKTLAWWVWFFSKSERRIGMCIWKCLMSKHLMEALRDVPESNDVVVSLFNVWSEKHGNQKWCRDADMDFVALSHRVFYTKPQF